VLALDPECDFRAYAITAQNIPIKQT